MNGLIIISQHITGMYCTSFWRVFFLSIFFFYVLSADFFLVTFIPAVKNPKYKHDEGYKRLLIHTACNTDVFSIRVAFNNASKQVQFWRLFQNHLHNIYTLTGINEHTNRLITWTNTQQCYCGRGNIKFCFLQMQCNVNSIFGKVWNRHRCMS